MHLGYVILYVANVLETVAFYEKAFNLQIRFIHETGAYAEMKTGQTILAFANEESVAPAFPFRKNSLKKTAAGAEIAFVTDDVEKQFKQAVRLGAKVVASPNAKPWGQIVSYVRDNNGFLVEICSPVHASV